MAVWHVLKRLWLGVLLIVAASSVLLISDVERRSHAKRRSVRIAILQHASSSVLDDGVEGMLDGLAAAGFADNGTDVIIRRYNAQGDMTTGNAIARQVTSGEFDLVMTSSTPSMQAVANANKEGKTIHIFGVVADPFSAGIGLDRANPLAHPKHMVGQSSFLPVDEAFRLARGLFPGLKTIGVAWNPAESNSLAFTLKAREACRDLAMTLLEANVDNTSAVVEAIDSLVSRGAEALWVGGDNVMMSAIDTAIATARRSRIPVFSITPGKPERGTLFDLGLDFHELGRLAGTLAADVLRGADPAKIPVRDVLDEVPRRIIINTLAVNGLKDPWRITAEARRLATVIVDGTGVHETAAAKTRPAGTRGRLSKKWRISLVEFNNVLDVEEAEQGVLEGLKEAGLLEGRDYETSVRNAQGDMATVSGLIDAALVGRADLLVTFSTPTLQAALQRTRSVPIVFNYVASAIAAGAGRSDTDHLPNVTGVYMVGAYEEMLALIRQCLPSARRLGTLYVPSEVNTVFQRDRMLEFARRANMELVTVAANTSAEIADAALALSTQKIDAICQLPGNLTAAAFPSIVQAARRVRLPVFAFQSAQARAGAAVVVARDYHDGGRKAAHIAARIMRGENPAGIPFEPLRETKVIVNLEAIRQAGLRVPESVIRQADEVIGK